MYGEWDKYRLWQYVRVRNHDRYDSADDDWRVCRQEHTMERKTDDNILENYKSICKVSDAMRAERGCHENQKAGCV